MTAGGLIVEPVPVAAELLFGANLELAVRYAVLLSSAGVERGLIGPHEPERLWSRHLVNCAAVAELFPEDARVVDVGSGAGLPGLALGLARPDLQLDLVEPLARRAQFLGEAVELLGLAARVRVVRGRAEDSAVVAEVGESQWVTARAVAPLDRLVGWCLPLLAGGGHLAALKGSSARAEIKEHQRAIARARGVNPRVVECGVGTVEPAVAVVLIERAPKPVSKAAAKRAQARSRGRGPARESKGKS